MKLRALLQIWIFIFHVFFSFPKTATKIVVTATYKRCLGKHHNTTPYIAMCILDLFYAY